jgi:hypothetical protein
MSEYIRENSTTCVRQMLFRRKYPGKIHVPFAGFKEMYRTFLAQSASASVQTAAAFLGEKEDHELPARTL